MLCLINRINPTEATILILKTMSHFYIMQNPINKITLSYEYSNILHKIITLLITVYAK